MKGRSLRDDVLKDIATIPGLSVESITRAGNHEKIRVATPSGIKLLVVSVSGSDWRASLNNRSILRRWAREGA
jgi:hypothetical protein